MVKIGSVVSEFFVYKLRREEFFPLYNITNISMDTVYNHHIR